MGKMKRLAFFLLAAALLMLAGCGGKSGGITLLDPRGVPAEAGPVEKAIYDQLEEALTSWAGESPQAAPVLRKAGGSELSALALMGTEHLPEMLLTDGAMGRKLAEAGLVLDLTALEEAESAAACKPFTYDGAVYAFPITAPAFTAIVYDPSILAEAAGEGAFPESPEAQRNLAAKLKDRGFGGLTAVADSGSCAVVTELLGPLLADGEGRAWLDHMIEGDGEAAFTDALFRARLLAAKELLADGVFFDRADSGDELIEAFLRGECPAVLLASSDVYRLLDRAKERDEALYDRLGFAALPGAEGAPVLPRDAALGLFLNVSLAEEPEKLETCLALCRRLSREPWGVEAAAADETVRRLASFLEASPSCPLCSRYLSGAWAFSGCGWLDGEGEGEPLTPEETAARLQDAYEKNYRRAADFSSQMDYFERLAKSAKPES